MCHECSSKADQMMMHGHICSMETCLDWCSECGHQLCTDDQTHMNKDDEIYCEDCKENANARFV